MNAKISVNNGRSFVSAEVAIEKVGFEEITSWMDDKVREEVHSMDFEGDRGFLEKYLEVSNQDIIVG